jgi:hypothetical protein
MKLAEMESYIESLKKVEFLKASFSFDLEEQKPVTKRIVIEM